MRRARRLLLCGGLAALVMALAWTAVAATRESAAPPGSVGPLAVVLLPGLEGSRLVVVDIAAGVVMRTVRLRSLVTDIDVEPGSGIVVAAQSGGVGSQVDDAVSLVDPLSGDVRYVTLPSKDPAQVACLGGRAYVLHSQVETSGLVLSVVDIAGGSVVASGHAPDGPGVWAAAGGRLWTVALGEAATAPPLVRIDPATLRTLGASDPGSLVQGVCETSRGVVVLGADERPARPGRVALLDARDGSVLASATAQALGHQPRIAAAVGMRLVVGDWNGEAPEGSRLAVFDARDLAQRGTIDVEGVPCALAGAGSHLLVVERLGGRLLSVDPSSGRVEARVDLGERDLIYSEVVVVQSRAAPARQ